MLFSGRTCKQFMIVSSVSETKIRWKICKCWHIKEQRLWLQIEILIESKYPIINGIEAVVASNNNCSWGINISRYELSEKLQNSQPSNITDWNEKHQNANANAICRKSELNVTLQLWVILLNVLIRCFFLFILIIFLLFIYLLFYIVTVRESALLEACS